MKSVPAVANVAASVASLIFGSNSEYMTHHLHDGARQLQPPFTIPDYTSPPTDYALAATPEAYRDDAVIDAGRDADANNTCFEEEVTVCQIPFVPPVESPRVGVVFYGGALVDPRAYSPIAKELSERYGIAVALQIFQADLAFGMDGTCSSGRVELASELFPSVEKFTLVGHSLGGVAAFTNVWSAQNDTDTKVGGLALLGSYIRQDIGCGPIDFSSTQLPTASVNGTLDFIVNSTNFEQGQSLLPVNDTFHMAILGGNHQQFGSYDDSDRVEILGPAQVDGNATIPEKVQLDMTISAIAHVASRMGIPLPEMEQEEEETVTSGGSSAIVFSLAVVTSSFLFSAFFGF